MSKPLTVTCPTCSAPLEWTPANRFRPFCSERCKLIDLGAWAAEEHAIPSDPQLDAAFSDELHAPGGLRH